MGCNRASSGIGMSARGSGTDRVVTPGLEQVDARLQAALAARITSDHDPDAPSADYYVSPETAWDDLQDADLSPFSARIDRAAVLLGLDLLAVEVLWLCAAPELDDRYGRI